MIWRFDIYIFILLLISFDDVYFAVLVVFKPRFTKTTRNRGILLTHALSQLLLYCSV